VQDPAERATEQAEQDTAQEGAPDAGTDRPDVGAIVAGMREAVEGDIDFEALGSLARKYRGEAKKRNLTTAAELAFRLVLATRRRDETRIAELLEELEEAAERGGQ
jgi:hypothetical protein